MLLACFWHASGMLLACFWHASGVLLACFGHASGMLLFWHAFGMLLACFGHASGMLLACFWHASGQRRTVREDAARYAESRVRPDDNRLQEARWHVCDRQSFAHALRRSAAFSTFPPCLRTLASSQRRLTAHHGWRLLHQRQGRNMLPPSHET